MSPMLAFGILMGFVDNEIIHFTDKMNTVVLKFANPLQLSV